MSDSIIPVIDLSPFLAGDAEGSRHVVQTIQLACETTGFFVIVGHGVSEELIEKMYQTSRTFFDRPVAEKNAIGMSGDLRGGVTYTPLLSERLAATQGMDTPGDLKETLNFGAELGGTLWPTQPIGLQEIWLAYYAAMCQLSRHLRSIFAKAIGLPDDFFEEQFVNHRSAVRVLNYPEQTVAPEPGQLRAGAHTDYGFLTILRSEASAGGLEVQDRDGTWHQAPSIPGSFVINIGDVMMRWTNDQWVSTMHRVGNPPSEQALGSRRQSMAFFLNPSAEAEIRCLDAFCSATSPAKYPPIRWINYMDEKQRTAES